MSKNLSREELEKYTKKHHKFSRLILFLLGVLSTTLTFLLVTAIILGLMAIIKLSLGVLI